MVESMNEESHPYTNIRDLSPATSTSDINGCANLFSLAPIGTSLKGPWTLSVCVKDCLFLFIEALFFC